jgi:hypothetical protein
MKLSSQALRELKECYQRQFGVSLGDDEANDKGIELLEFFRIVYRPIPKNNYENEELYDGSQ